MLFTLIKLEVLKLPFSFFTFAKKHHSSDRINRDNAVYDKHKITTTTAYVNAMTNCKKKPIGTLTASCKHCGKVVINK